MLHVRRSDFSLAMSNEGERSLTQTPSWAVATVITVLVATGFSIHGGLNMFGKWLNRTKRKQLSAALDKIKEELMVFGLLSLLMGHWIFFVSKICVKTSAMSSRFYPCDPRNFVNHQALGDFNSSGSPLLMVDMGRDSCPQDHEPFASYESLEQLHRFLFVLGTTHVLYSFLAVALAMIKIYSWRTWENHAKTLALRGLLMVDTSADSETTVSDGARLRRFSSFILNRTSHPWSRHRLLVWLLCFSRQFWSSISQADYMALRIGFIKTHQLPFTYDFHNYMLRSMEEEFRDIVGISLPLWIFTITCIILGFHVFYVIPLIFPFLSLYNLMGLEIVMNQSHPPVLKFFSQLIVISSGTNIYFWISFLPAVLIFLVGTKLHHIVVKLAVEIMDSSQWTGFREFNLRDELFWFGNPRLLLRLIQFVSFQNAFEMSTYIWSLWEIKEPSCYTGNRTFLVVRLTFGVVSQFWCSFITFPLYVIVAQMGSKFKKAIISENVRKSLHGWRRKVITRNGPEPVLKTLITAPSSSIDENNMEIVSGSVEQTSTSSRHGSV